MHRYFIVAAMLATVAHAQDAPAPSPAPEAPKPITVASGAAGKNYLNLSLDGLIAVGASTEPDVPAEQHATQVAVRDFMAAAIARGEIVDVEPGVLMQLIGGLALQCGLLIARAPDPDATRATLGVAVGAMLRGLACIP